MVNELRLNYTFGRFTKNFPPMFDALTGRNFSTELGLPSLTPGGLPEFTTGPAAIGWSLSQQNENAEHSYGIANNLSWTQGNMSWKFGVDLSQQRLKTIPMFGASGGRYEFNRNLTLTNSTGGNAAPGERVRAVPARHVQPDDAARGVHSVLLPVEFGGGLRAKRLEAAAQPDAQSRPALLAAIAAHREVRPAGRFLPDLAREFPITNRARSASCRTGGQ